MSDWIPIVYCRGNNSGSFRATKTINPQKGYEYMLIHGSGKNDVLYIDRRLCADAATVVSIVCAYAVTVPNGAWFIQIEMDDKELRGPSLGLPVALLLLGVCSECIYCTGALDTFGKARHIQVSPVGGIIPKMLQAVANKTALICPNESIASLDTTEDIRWKRIKKHVFDIKDLYSHPLNAWNERFGKQIWAIGVDDIGEAVSAVNILRRLNMLRVYEDGILMPVSDYTADNLLSHENLIRENDTKKKQRTE